jgi:hypothetical protein
MKHVFKIIPIFALLLTSVQLIAQENRRDRERDSERKKYEFVRSRDISKTYPASGNTLKVVSQFGDVKINTWEKNEIKVDIHIEASSNIKELADATFEKIDVKDKHEGSVISFETIFDKEKEKKDFSCNNCSNTMEINYVVYMPSTNKLTIDNSFGSVSIPDYNGPVSLYNKYGSLEAGKMAKLEKLEVEFGSAHLKYLSNADVTFKYSSITIDNLSGSNEITMEFCGYSKINLDNDLSSLKLHDSYSTVHLRTAANFSASYDISTSYGSFIDKTGAGIKRTDKPGEYGPDLDKHYEGKSGSGAAKVTVTSSFGKVMIGEGKEDDMVEKRKVRT